MILSKKWTSIVEALIVMLIVVTWVVWMYNIYANSIKVSDSSSNRVKAISIAREWIEAMINIRDTNWLLFSANNTNCWNTLNYDSSCVTSDIDISSWSYIIYKNSNDRWYLSWITLNWNYSTWTYKNDFRVNLWNDWFYTQSGGINFLPWFTREIKISYLTWEVSPYQKMNIESIVKWSDNSTSSWNFEVKLKTVLTNWKK